MKLAHYVSIACVVMLGLNVGCNSGPKLGQPVEAKGVVTMDGAPLSNVTVGFSAISKDIPVEARFVSVETESDGTFVIEKIYPAEYMVTLNEPAAEAKEGEQVAAVAGGNPKLAKYANNSNLRVTIKESDNDDIKLEADSMPEVEAK